MIAFMPCMLSIAVSVILGERTPNCALKYAHTHTRQQFYDLGSPHHCICCGISFSHCHHYITAAVVVVDFHFLCCRYSWILYAFYRICMRIRLEKKKRKKNQGTGERGRCAPTAHRLHLVYCKRYGRQKF